MQKSKKKNKTLRSKKKLVKDLDNVVRDIIRERDKYCVCCGASRASNQLQVGHYKSRRHYATRWDLKNCHAQCPECNTLHNKTKKPYKLFMIRNYGEGIIEELEQKIRDHDRYTRVDLSEKLKELRKNN